MFRTAYLSMCIQIRIFGSSDCVFMAMGTRIFFLQVLLLLPTVSDPTVWQPMQPDMLPEVLYANRAGFLDIESIFRFLECRFWVCRPPGYELWGTWLRSWRIRINSHYYYVLCELSWRPSLSFNSGTNWSLIGHLLFTNWSLIVTNWSLIGR